MAGVTELLPVPRPIVFGFLRVRNHGNRATALAAALQAYCAEHELALSDVVVETSHVDDAFAGLVEVMTRSRAYGIVVPSRSHLGGSATAEQRSAHIARARLRLIVIRLANRVPQPVARVPAMRMDGGPDEIVRPRTSRTRTHPHSRLVGSLPDRSESPS